jgi:hypothetical protein
LLDAVKARFKSGKIVGRRSVFGKVQVEKVAAIGVELAFPLNCSLDWFLEQLFP